MSTKYVIHPIVVGSKRFDKGFMTYQQDMGTPYVIPLYAWYIEGGDKKILVDSGELRPIVTADREEFIGGKIETIEEGLARFGLTPEDIDIVIHTHLHRDHCENDYKFTNATFYVHEKELEVVHDPHPLDYRYQEDFILDVEENGQIVTVKEDTEVVPGVKMIHTPAHTEGSMSVLVDTAKGKALITGFCCIMDNFYPPKEVKGLGMEVIPPSTCLDLKQAYDIVLECKNMADIILPLHEPRFAKGDPIG
uniref:N-acyl homoserine lactonase family protein n=1 Tax=Fundidesulfovibrio putealis TaxID=270496 RepID=A0A7C4AI15_9BACT